MQGSRSIAKSELKLDLCCLLGAVVGCNVVAIPCLGIAMLFNHLFVSKPVAGADPSLPTSDQIDWLFFTAIALPLAALVGVLGGWAFTVRLIRKYDPSYKII